MSLVGPEPVQVYFGLNEGAISVRSHEVEWLAYDSIDEGLKALFAKVGALPRKFFKRRVPVRVWLSGALARPFLFGPVGGVQTWDEVTAVAEASAPDTTGIEGPCAVQVEAWPDKSPVLATAIGRALLDALEHAAREHRIHIRSLRPWWAAALNHVLSKDVSPRLACVTDHDAMLLFGGTGTQFDAINSYMPRMSPEQTDKLVSRLALVTGTPLGEVPRIALSRSQSGTPTNVPFGVSEGSK